MAEPVHFYAGDILLEGLYVPASKTRGVVITHPHPLYGGDMTNPVVQAIEAAYREQGFTTLRFNFRGTGSSAGRFQDGVAERTDVKGAIDFLRAKGIDSIHLSGYSFGAWVNAMALQDHLPAAVLTMVAPPVAVIDFGDTIRLPTLSTVVAGSRDAFAPPDRIRPLMGRWNPRARMAVIDGADHFFSGFLNCVTRSLKQRAQPNRPGCTSP